MESTNFCPDTPHFHRMILQDSLFDNKLKIPKEFMVKYGSNIDTSKPIVVKVPGGGAWKMKLTKCDGHIWLGEGWPSFARHYSIERGYSLFFRYEGQSRFHVVIIDVNGSEICYPAVVITTSKHSDGTLNPTNIIVAQEEDEEFDSHENLNRKRKEKLAPPFSSPKRRKKELFVSSDNDDDEYAAAAAPPPKDQVNMGDSECVESVNKTGMLKALAKKGGSRVEEHFRSMTVEEKDEALFRMTNLTSQYPYFKIVLKKMHLHDRYELALPAEFWRENVGEKSDLDITLYVPHNGRTWLGKLQIKARNGSPRAVISIRCWREFAVENCLKLSDVCTFELTNKNEMMFKVSINRARLCDQNNQQSEGNVKLGAKSKDHTSDQVTQGAFSSSRGGKFSEGATVKQSNPSFEIILGQSAGKLKRIPLYISNNFLQGKPGAVTIQVGKKLWGVNLSGGSGGLFFCGGWPKFVKENHLQPGDSCLFELVTKETDTDNTLLNATISRRINPAAVSALISYRT
ncbi:hypothetical protein F8388_017047 [Cannabis sativa]|uniref:TF-B3 domain-containing protein n=1 Tax=Cannabis sativa TaxID=3483 RepID=A0A7J6HFH6_CANSA|nr:hypothetical protein F8388_017047 [Cannabis sativa]KAF4393170.1 hypothetical protein G4B88_001904 [Cannabis sativa]